jgi:hypothetical protein
MNLAEDVTHACETGRYGCRDITAVHMRMDQINPLLTHPMSQRPQPPRLEAAVEWNNRNGHTSLFKLISQRTTLTNAHKTHAKR